MSNILYGHNQSKRKLYEDFLDKVNEKIVGDKVPEVNLPDDSELPKDDVNEDLSGYEGKVLGQMLGTYIEPVVSQLQSINNKIDGLRYRPNGLKEEAKEKQVIYKVDGKYKMTPKSNYENRIQDARKVQDLDDFSSPEEIKDYYLKYGWVESPDEFEVINESEINEAKTADPEGLGAELEEIKKDLEDFGPEGFYGVKFSNFLKEFPHFGKEVILSWIKEMEIRSPEEMKDEETIEADWATGELIIPEDWPCLIDGATRMVNGRGPDKSKHWILWDKIWKTHYKAYDESLKESVADVDVEYIVSSYTSQTKDDEFFDNLDDAIKFAEDNNMDVIIKVDYTDDGTSETVWENPNYYDYE